MARLFAACRKAVVTHNSKLQPNYAEEHQMHKTLNLEAQELQQQKTTPISYEQETEASIHTDSPKVDK